MFLGSRRTPILSVYYFWVVGCVFEQLRVIIRRYSWRRVRDQATLILSPSRRGFRVLDVRIKRNGRDLIIILCTSKYYIYLLGYIWTPIKSTLWRNKAKNIIVQSTILRRNPLLFIMVTCHLRIHLYRSLIAPGFSATDLITHASLRLEASKRDRIAQKLSKWM